MTRVASLTLTTRELAIHATQASAVSPPRRLWPLDTTARSVSCFKHTCKDNSMSAHNVRCYSEHSVWYALTAGGQWIPLSD